MENTRKKVIIDTDMGWDDILSILYLIRNPTIEIIGITVTGCGEANLRWGTIIAKTLMDLGDQTQAKICVGTSTPLKFNHVFPQSFRDNVNDIMGLLGSLNPETSIDVQTQPAWEFIADTLNKTEESITILSLGGFTNLAKMLELCPSTRIDKITEIYAMAGAVYVDGNIALFNDARPEWNQGPIYKTNYAAEWNVFIDPVAAKKVFKTHIPITLIPLDACNYVILNPDYVDKITATDPIARLTKDIFKKVTGVDKEAIPVPIFDPLAAVIMAGGIKEYQAQSEYLDVNITDTAINNQCGKTYIVDSGSRKITIVQGVSQNEFAINFSNMINGKAL
ncbi:Inosine-uridine preferring nucleoside hydrolase (EC [Bathymodiolus thermophilus thioautotrophic gill symbiont]|uniref:nucleoside hydrolase n=1 Tax=Bathymodiolus thermophilus thioautotrophic gill symbiont TaxID=2360 RepID=UPI00192B137A|nr:nucleoside hydrolase [Bathymodiolus thermophilus thioautotrophic gill symbiont]CAB5498216.1 Inosine-uridine preferring nucleoside hydrolase (EC [Bathymodiolus thermophilus thioautotrophic gill symbiont]